MARGDMKALIEGTTRRRLVDFALWHRINEREDEAGVGRRERDWRNATPFTGCQGGSRSKAVSGFPSTESLSTRSNLPGLFVGHP
jgi:hypothetical protein